MPPIPVLTDTLRWVVTSGGNISLVAGNTTIIRGAFTGRRNAVRLDWRGCFTDLAAASRALGLTVAETEGRPVSATPPPMVLENGMDPNCPDEHHVHGWYCPTCDTRPKPPRPPPEPDAEVDDGSWVDDHNLGAQS